MRWVLCGLTFAMAVTLAIGTAAIRAGNVRLMRRIHDQCHAIALRQIELDRLQVLAATQVTPERLVEVLRTLVDPTPPAAAPVAEDASWQ